MKPLARDAKASALLICSNWASYLPSNLARLALLRRFGADLGRGVALHHGLQLRYPGGLTLGDDCFVAEHVTFDARGGISVGSHVSINSGAQIWTASHDWRSPDFAYVERSVTIGDRAWISARAIVLPGTVIGEGAVVAAGAVVAGTVAPWTVVAGVPAKRIADRPVVDSYRLNAARHKIWFW